MFRAILIKELRETRIITIVAAILYTIFILGTIYPYSNSYVTSSLKLWKDITIPFVGDYTENAFFLIAGLMAAALGLWQTFGESVRGTYPFLLHRPASIRWLIVMKMVTGLAIYLIVTAIPIWIYALWAATPGNHASPFEWSMTIPAWVSYFAMTMIYFGAFFSGLMPGRWYGTRFLPLIFTACALFPILVINDEICATKRLCLVILVVDIWIITLILFVARTRDYS